MDKYKVLIVDDEVDNLALLYRTLRGKYEIAKTTSPLEALEMLDGNDYQLIISDHKMPEMDGVEFLKRTCETHPNSIRLLVTAYSDAKILIDAINYAKIYRYIKKPYAPEELLHIVDASLEYYQLKADNESLINDLKELFSGTISAITEALDAKDSYTLGRSRRVAYYSVKMAEKLELSKLETGRIELAGLLHDIGMIGVTEEIINKTETLTPEEFEEIKKHVDHGVKILEDISQLKDVVNIIKYHHEHFDGNGYPQGSKGEEIPVGSRIIAVADAYDGLVSDRIYRKGYDDNVALEKLKEKSGTQFDPKIVEIFNEILPDIKKEIEDNE